MEVKPDFVIHFGKFDELVDAVEQEVGMSVRGWDFASTHDLMEAVLTKAVELGAITFERG